MSDERVRLLWCSAQSQYAEAIEAILLDAGISDWVRHTMVHGADRDGRHHGDKIFPGHVAAFWAYVPADGIDDVLEQLRTFRDASPAHAHLRAAVIAPEIVL